MSHPLDLNASQSDINDRSNIGQSESQTRLKQNWSTVVVGCGSNAFGQLNSIDPQELIRPTLLPLSLNAKRSNIDLSKNVDIIACGANTCASVPRKSPSECYLWGEGVFTSPLKIPTQFPVSKHPILQISCGQTHAGIITVNGQVFTWGQGEHGKLGLGGKQNCTSPKLVSTLENQIALQISCGAYHTAIIAAAASEIMEMTIPLSNSDDSIEETTLRCGNLYTCGLNKAGQLGLGDVNKSGQGKFNRISMNSKLSCVSTPSIVKHFVDQKCHIGQVACGFHHTLVISCEKNDQQQCFSTVYSFGYGDQGRLGLGDEELRQYPCKVVFPSGRLPSLFNVIQVSAGEQHSLCRGYEHSFGWGSNSMGQLGIGNPTTIEFSLEPVPIILPEGMKLKSISAGSRHSAAITTCGKVLAWGWGEEGQLGHGSEKSSYLPRPCKLPRYEGVIGTPIALCAVIEAPIVEPPLKDEYEIKSIESPQEDPISPPKTPVMQSAHTKSAVFITDDEEVITRDKTRTPVRSIGDILSLRNRGLGLDEGRDDDISQSSGGDEENTEQSENRVSVEQQNINTLAEEILAQPPPEPIEQLNMNSLDEEIIEQPPPEPVLRLDLDDQISLPPQSPVKYCTTNTQIVEPAESFALSPLLQSMSSKSAKSLKSLPSNEAKSDVFYRPGQDMSKCYVANSAMRAEIRKAMKKSSDAKAASKK